ncbi:FAD-linked oxidase C-terminal domain-containing protein [Clostridioides difficile]|uniref:FAD-linked oxidase C-terminal domain-containing protein n=1 Tax=Clostridioides difficile TaxID=1496 RepID=UPI003F8D269F
MKSFGHAGDGNLHIYILKDGMDDNTWKIRLKETFDYMYKKSRTQFSIFNCFNFIL